MYCVAFVAFFAFCAAFCVGFSAFFASCAAFCVGFAAFFASCAAFSGFRVLFCLFCFQRTPVPLFCCLLFLPSPCKLPMMMSQSRSNEGVGQPLVKTRCPQRHQVLPMRADSSTSPGLRSLPVNLFSEEQQTTLVRILCPFPFLVHQHDISNFAWSKQPGLGTPARCLVLLY